MSPPWKSPSTSGSRSPWPDRNPALALDTKSVAGRGTHLGAATMASNASSTLLPGGCRLTAAELEPSHEVQRPGIRWLTPRSRGLL